MTEESTACVVIINRGNVDFKQKITNIFLNFLTSQILTFVAFIRKHLLVMLYSVIYPSLYGLEITVKVIIV